MFTPHYLSHADQLSCAICVVCRPSEQDSIDSVDAIFCGGFISAVNAVRGTLHSLYNLLLLQGVTKIVGLQL